LEVGCGNGELALSVAAAGYSVVAIDPRAPSGEIFRRVKLEEFSARDTFDAVIASRSLHHVVDLHDGVERIAALLRPRGLLIVDEHAWDRLDHRTVQWYLRQVAADHRHVHDSLDGWLADWQREHAGLHGYVAMRREVDQRFAERFFAWQPYLYRELGGPSLETEERRLIDSGEIRATGFQYVGELRLTAVGSARSFGPGVAQPIN
jgi:SAM-dependent methyltransferase